MTTTERPTLTPTSLADTQKIISAAGVDVGPNGEPVPNDAAPETPTTSAAIPEPAVAPAAQLPPENTPEGRIVRGITTGAVVYTAADVDAVRDRLSPDEYHDLHAAAVIADRRRATVTTYQTEQLTRLHERVPEARDPETRRQLADELTAYASQFDYTPQEILAVNDSRAIELARDGLRKTQRVRELEQELAKYRAGTAEPDERETPARQTQTRRKPAPRIDPEELRPMSMREARRLMLRFVDD